MKHEIDGKSAGRQMEMQKQRLLGSLMGQPFVASQAVGSQEIQVLMEMDVKFASSSCLVLLPSQGSSLLSNPCGFTLQDPSPSAMGWYPRTPASPVVCTASVGPRVMP